MSFENCGSDLLRIWFGLAYAITGLGALLSGPINDALLGSDFIWLGAIIFSGVSLANVLSLSERQLPTGFLYCWFPFPDGNTPDYCEEEQDTASVNIRLLIV